MNDIINADSLSLAQRWRDLCDAEPTIRQRDAASKLGVSEGELVATKTGNETGNKTTRLRPSWKEILADLRDLGDVMVLTRNEHAVVEKIGTYEPVSVRGPMGLVLGEKIDLRLFLNKWCHVFACVDEMQRGTMRSLQFYDASGTAIQKVYLREDSDTDAFYKLVDTYRQDQQSSELVIEPEPEPKPEQPDADINVDGLIADWDAMKDSHQFFGLLRKFGCSRTQALRLASPKWTTRVETKSYRIAFEKAVETELPIMVFVGNRGGIEIHSGPIRTIRIVKDWFNILDTDFNLHLKESPVHEVWVVCKPTADGVVTSIELYDKLGESIAYIFSKRKEGESESQTWREIVAGLPRIEG